ncbi:hypothetical protein THAOC_17568 [Thalassiosira oceanica]|uniref:Uncharacterized protein n=1 Tax=Thalassiosira oceanica TaxID=159749 RepID=K0SA83_THAOC|nr:hypothetical protein THAOC_17568 [Thalassiosira oceanica]|eukprot:EJK61864.1 hypothetical protein THAOC_17568 [Thalassiosira oceanica]
MFATGQPSNKLTDRFEAREAGRVVRRDHDIADTTLARRNRGRRNKGRSLKAEDEDARGPQARAPAGHLGLARHASYDTSGKARDSRRDKRAQATRDKWQSISRHAGKIRCVFINPIREAKFAADPQRVEGVSGGSTPIGSGEGVLDSGGSISSGSGGLICGLIYGGFIPSWGRLERLRLASRLLGARSAAARSVVTGSAASRATRTAASLKQRHASLE